MGIRKLIQSLLGPATTRSSIVGTWRLANLEVPHPFLRYEFTLSSDGTCAYDSEVSTKQGEFTVSGSGTWTFAGAILQYSLGDSSESAKVNLVGDTMILDRIPAVQIAAGTPCTFQRVT